MVDRDYRQCCEWACMTAYLREARVGRAPGLEPGGRWSEHRTQTISRSKPPFKVLDNDHPEPGDSRYAGKANEANIYGENDVEHVHVSLTALVAGGGSAC